MDKLNLVCEKIRTIDTLLVCNGYGIVPELFGIRNYTLIGGTGKTNLFSGKNSDDNACNKLVYSYVETDELKNATAGLDDAHRMMLVKEAIDVLKSSVGSSKEFGFANLTIPSDAKVFKCNNNITLFILPDNKIQLCGESCLHILDLDDTPCCGHVADILREYVTKRFKTDITVYISDDLRNDVTCSILAGHIEASIPDDRVVLVRPTQNAHVFLYTEKNLNNCQVTAESTEGMRKEHWAVDYNMNPKSLIGKNHWAVDYNMDPKSLASELNNSDGQ